MHPHRSALGLHTRPLAVALAVAVGVVASSASVASSGAQRRDHSIRDAGARDGGALAPNAPRASSRSGTIPLVPACSEAALRQAIMSANDGETISIPMGCSAITLTAGAIAVGVDNLTILGPGADAFTLYGGRGSGNYDRVFRHTGAGTLEIDGMTIADAAVYNAVDAQGGCIDSDGTVYLKQSVIASCYMASDVNIDAEGGAIFAQKGVKMYESRISDSEVYSIGNLAKGGAIATLGDLDIERSTISGNIAASSTPTYSTAGGIAVFNADATVRYSTISGNQAADSAGIYVIGNMANSALVIDSTISGNSASDSTGGAAFQVPATIANSTVTSNTSVNTFFGVGVYASDVLTIDSSIFSNNLTPAGDAGVDVYTTSGTIGGGKSLIVLTSSAVPQDTIRTCPRLGPLADNGGPTFTHALLSGSPAIDAGDNSQMLSFDQRLDGFDRSFGATTDIGAYEWQGDLSNEIFLSRFEFGCD